MTVAYVFVDANTALHFKRPDQIDWCALTGTERVVLVGAPILLRELENQKIHNASRKLRERASNYVKWLVQFVRDPSILVREHTTWQFVPTEPSIDFASHNLSPTIADDHLIASVIAFKQESGGSPMVATADLGLEMKLRHRGFAPLLLPDDVRLPDEPDSAERELEKLRRAAARQRIPDLKLTCEGEGICPMKISPQVTKPNAPSLADVRKQHPDPDVQGGTAMEASVAAVFRSSFLSPEDLARYRNDRSKFLGEYESFLVELLRWEEGEALTVSVNLGLLNDGTAPASDIDVILFFPDDLILIEGDRPKRPEQPKAPRSPSRFGLLDHLSRRDYTDFARFTDPHVFNLVPSNIDTPTSVRISGSRVNHWVRNLKHGFEEELETVHFRFQSRADVRQFRVEYEISASELPDVIRGDVHFVLSPQT